MLIAKGLIGGLFQLALFSAFLVVPAGLAPGGTWYWERALIFFGAPAPTPSSPTPGSLPSLLLAYGGPCLTNSPAQPCSSISRRERTSR